MDIAALIAWLVTATAGFTLLGIWIAKGGLRQQEDGTSRFPPALVVGHFLLATVGLLVWIAFLISDESAGIAWTGFGILLPVAVLGFALLFRWWGGRRELTPAAVVGDVPDVAGSAVSGPAEQRFPLLLVAGHGLVAVATIVLVVIAALDVT